MSESPDEVYLGREFQDTASAPAIDWLEYEGKSSFLREVTKLLRITNGSSWPKDSCRFRLGRRGPLG